jgi:transcriptional regulator with XRE-family HTH domain
MNIPEAIRSLRQEYGEGQQKFSTRIGMSMASIANYESGMREPDGPSAVKLARAALDKERPDLARVFENIIRDSMGGLVAPIHTDDEHRKIRAVQYVLFDDRFKELRKPLDKLLAPVEDHLRNVERKLARNAKKLQDDLDEMNKKGLKK